jgi:hypothetical protein
LASICFAFEPRDDQPDLDKAGGNVIMIPNGDKKHLAFYLSTLVQDFTARILVQLEQNTLAQANVPYISTPRDSATTSDDIVKLKKKKAGRYLSKHGSCWLMLCCAATKRGDAEAKGDAALLLGSPDDALNWYSQAVEQTRAANDVVWMAAALEGVASGALAQQTRWHTTPPSDDALLLVADRVREAVAVYRRKKEISLEVRVVPRAPSNVDRIVRRSSCRSEQCGC